MSTESPWLDAPAVDDSEPWKAAPVVESKDTPWEAAPVVEEQTAPVAAAPAQFTRENPKPVSEEEATRKSKAAGVAQLLTDEADLGGFLAASTPTGVASMDVSGPARAGVLETPTGFTQGSINLKGAAESAFRLAQPAIADAVLGSPKASGIHDALIPSGLEQPLITLPKPTGNTIPAAIARGLAPLAEGLTSPENIGLLTSVAGAPVVLQRIASAGFAAMMGTSIPDKVQAWRSAKTPVEATERLTDLLATSAMTLAAAAHANSRMPAEGARPPSLSQGAADAAATQNQIRSLAPEVPYAKESQQILSEATVDGLVLARNKLREGFSEQSPEAQQARNDSIDLIDDQLLRFDRNEVAQAESRVKEQRALTETAAPQGTLPVQESPAAPAMSTGGPPAEGGRSSLFAQARRDAGIPDEAQVQRTEQRPQEAAPETQRITEAGAPVEGAVPGGIDPEILRTYTESAERIADQVSQGQPTAVRDAARDAALDNARSSLEGGKTPSVSFMRKSAQKAAGEAAGRQAESLDAPVNEGQTLADTLVAPEPTRTFDAEAQGILDRAPLTPAERRIVDALKTGEHDSISAAADALGISRSAATQSFNAALEKLQSMGPGAASALEPLARYEDRRFGTRFGESADIAPEIRQAAGNRFYEVLPNKVTAAEAVKIIDERGIENAISLIRDLSNDTSPAVRSTIGQVVIKKLNEQYRSLKDVNPVEADAVLNKAADLAEWQMEYGTRLGQGVQSFAMWSRLSPEGKLRTYEKTVDRTRTKYKKDTGGEVDQIKDILNGDGTDAQKRTEFKDLEKTNETARKVKSKLDKLLEVARDGRLTDEAFFNMVSERLGLPEYSPDVVKEIIRLGSDVDAAAEGMPRNEALAKLTQYMAEKKGFSAGELPLGIYYGNILSGYNTQIVNALDTGLNVFSEVSTMALDNPKAIPALLRGVVRGLGEGKADALLALSEGRKVTDGKYAEQTNIMEASKFGEKGGVPISTATRTGKILKAAAESPLAKPLNAYKYVGRLMSASDTVFFRAAEEARAALLAFREAEATGNTKANLRAEADRILGYDRLDEFKKQAAAEGYKGVKADARVTELMMAARPEALREAAGDFAGLATYNHAPEGALGYLANKMSEVSTKIPALKLIVPFTRIVANVTNRGLDWTPYGYKRALAGRTFGDGPFIGEARRAELTKATAGTAGLVGLGILNQLGVIQVHGGGPSDPQKKRQLQAAGWKPYTIQIGDKYISYLPTPLALGVSSLGNYLDADRYKELGQKDALTRTAYALSRVPSTVFNQSFLSSLSSVFQALSSSSPGQQLSELKKTFSRTVTGFTVPNIAQDMNRLFDPAYRDSDSIAEDVIRNIPVARLKLRESLNAYGEPALQPSNRFLSSMKSDPAWRIVVEKNLRIPVADDTAFTDPKAGYEYQKEAGKRMRRYMESMLPRFRTMDRGQIQESLTSAAENQFASARALVRSKYPGSLKQKSKRPK